MPPAALTSTAFNATDGYFCALVSDHEPPVTYQLVLGLRAGGVVAGDVSLIVTAQSPDGCPAFLLRLQLLLEAVCRFLNLGGYETDHPAHCIERVVRPLLQALWILPQYRPAGWQHVQTHAHGGTQYEHYFRGHDPGSGEETPAYLRLVEGQFYELLTPAQYANLNLTLDPDEVDDAVD